MKQELLLALIRELLQADEIHEEYTDNNVHYVIDSEKTEDNSLIITISLEEDNDDRKQFEKWAENLDDDLFNEAYEALSENYLPGQIGDMYKSDDYQIVIDGFKEKVKEIAKKKIEQLEKALY